MLFRIRGERETGFADRLVQLDRGQRVLQALARPHVEMHVAGRNQAHPALLLDALQAVEPGQVVAEGQQLRRQPAVVREPVTQPARLGEQGRVRFPMPRHPEGEAILQPRLQVLRQQPVAALGGTPPGRGDQLRQVAVAIAVTRQQHQAGSVEAGAEVAWDGGIGAGIDGMSPCCACVDQADRRKLRADQQGEMSAARLQMGPDDTRQRAFVGNGQGGIAEIPGAIDQFLRVRCTPQERKVAHAVQFRVRGDHRGRGTAAAGRFSVIHCILIQWIVPAPGGKVSPAGRAAP